MIYFDHNATTPPLAEVTEAIVVGLREQWGNPSSVHAMGLKARRALESARTQVAETVQVDPRQVVFTGSATEAVQLAIHSALAQRGTKNRVVVAATEHAAVRENTRELASLGVVITTVPAGRDGTIKPEVFRAALGPDVFLACAMWANNETGVLHPVAEFAETCAQQGTLFLCDAVQALGKVPVNLAEATLSYTVLSAHKINGPKGVGALVLGREAPCTAQILGGHQENQHRAGTENIPGIVGFSIAAQRARHDLDQRMVAAARLRDAFEESVLLMGGRIHGRTAPRLSNTSNVAFPGIDGETLVELLDLEGVCVSTGSACHSGTSEPSPVILAMTGSYQQAKEAVRFSFGANNTEAELTSALAGLRRVLARLR